MSAKSHFEPTKFLGYKAVGRAYPESSWRAKPPAFFSVFWKPEAI